MAFPRMLKHVSLATFAALAISAASIRAEDKPATAAAPAAAPLGQPDANGFISLFNGKDLTGWEGLEGYWSVKNGVIDGSETKDNSVQTDLILSASKEHPEKFANFELHIKWMLVSPDGNSGVQFRSVINNPKTLHVGGYQADIDSGGNYTGSIYDESGIAGGRGTMSNRGEKTNGTPRIGATTARFRKAPTTSRNCSTIRAIGTISSSSSTETTSSTTSTAT